METKSQIATEQQQALEMSRPRDKAKIIIAAAINFFFLLINMSIFFFWINPRNVSFVLDPWRHLQKTCVVSHLFILEISNLQQYKEKQQIPTINELEQEKNV